MHKSSKLRSKSDHGFNKKLFIMKPITLFQSCLSLLYASTSHKLNNMLDV